MDQSDEEHEKKIQQETDTPQELSSSSAKPGSTEREKERTKNELDQAYAENIELKMKIIKLQDLLNKER